jgi:hypothetical protein
MISISLENLDPKPSAVYFGNNSSRYATALGFSSHTQVMTLLDRENAPYFKHCQPCQFNKIYQATGNTKVGCPGGIQYLKTSSSVDVVRMPETRHRMVQDVKNCRRIIAEEFSFSTSIEVPFTVKLPDYILVNRRGYDWDSSYKLKAYLAKPDAASVDDLYKGISFIFGNVHSSGSVCLGTARDNVSWLKWYTIQEAFLNFSRNNDWTEYWKSSSTPELQTLVDYATRLNHEGASFVNKFQYSDYSNWRMSIFNDFSGIQNRWVIPYQDSYKAILFDKNNTNKFYLQLVDGSYLDTDLSPILLETNPDEWQLRS